ncbi:uncharacterized protein DUF4179 [Fontibacillus phaseoli]|uniref:Uncharacterized protein DUF4179 n=1 Tax=Fontibacillus phaseoli TaxID=1416533 RepID=A0A369BAX7_9BACL|nr:DUF4179 domain-containing protein [Fontibacillus phaseoli]RCX18485.1 uncharacterized protein DUF4179 [Fontibacillus phaseoli]
MDEKKEMRYTQFFDEMRQSEEQVSEEQLDAAIRNGIQRGKQRRRRATFLRGSGIVAGALASFLLLLAVWQLGPPSKPGAVLGSPGSTIPDYVQTLMTSNMQPAADHGLYQPVNRMAEIDGYRMTVDGVLADSRKMIVFFTTENLSDSRSKMDFTPKLLGPDGKEMSMPRFTSSGQAVPDKNISHSYYTVSFVEGWSTPDQFTFSGQFSKDRDPDAKKATLEVPVQIDSSKYADLERIVPINQSATIQGNEIRITEMILTPLSTIIRVKPDYSSPNKGLWQIKDAKLYLGETKKNQFQYFLMVRQSEHNILNDKANLSALHYDSIYYSDWNKVTLRASRFTEISYSESKINIDTGKKEVKTSNSVAQLEDVIQRKDSTEIRLQYDRKDSDLAIPIKLQDHFSDNSGTKYSFKDGVYTNYFSMGSKVTISCHLEPREYEQPLTFTLTSATEQDIKQPLEVNINMKK